MTTRIDIEDKGITGQDFDGHYSCLSISADIPNWLNDTPPFYTAFKRVNRYIQLDTSDAKEQ